MKWVRPFDQLTQYKPNWPYQHRRKTLTFDFILDRDASKQIRPCTGSGAPALNILIIETQIDLNGKCGVINSGPVLAPSVYLGPAQIVVPPWATPILCQMKYTSVQVSYL